MPDRAPGMVHLVKSLQPFGVEPEWYEVEHVSGSYREGSISMEMTNNDLLMVDFEPKPVTWDPLDEDGYYAVVYTIKAKPCFWKAILDGQYMLGSVHHYTITLD